MKVSIIGHEMTRPHVKKVRIVLESSAEKVMEVLEEKLDLREWPKADKIYGQIADIEVDIWLNTETGSVIVDGAQ